MADDIDIEEHDVMDNPMIKQIFPDISILKNEILDYNDVEMQHELNSVTKTIDAIANPLYTNSNINNNAKDKSSKTQNTINNKISFKNKKVKMDLFSVVRIYLKNIRPELIRSNKFCKICHILFSNADGLRNHNFFYHNDKQYSSVKQVWNADSIEKGKNRELCTNAKTFEHNENNSNDKYNINETERREKNKMNDVMVKINDRNDESDLRSLMKPCFHCSVLFSSQQSLIDHLYEILNNRNSKLKHRNEKEIIRKKYEMLHSEKEGKQKMNLVKDDTRSRKLYCCPICSYYFNVKKFCDGHLLSKHNVNKKGLTECRYFNSKCKFCDLNFHDFLSYNTHIRECHRNEMIKKCNNELFLPKNKDFQNPSNTAKCQNETDLRTLNSNSKYLNDKLLAYGINEVRVLASKGIIFQCSDCKIHFLTSDAAKNHFEHGNCLINWKCLKCNKIFKLEHQILHRKQHLYSNNFSVIEVNGDRHRRYKCPKCGELFKKENFSDHKTTCESENIIKVNNITQYYSCSICKCNTPNNDDEKIHHECSGVDLEKHVCDLCGLMFSSSSISDHKILHQLNNVKLQDFTFFDLKTEDQIKPIIPDLPKCISCEMHYIDKYEVLRHECGKDKHIVCPACKIKLSTSAYTVHEQFHCYELKVTENQASNISVSNKNNSKLSEVKEDNRSLTVSCIKNEIRYLYTCKNCNISMHAYDEVIEHCHTHTHLNKIDVDEIECTICNITLLRSSYKEHQKLHLIYTKEQIKFLSFDVLYFDSHNDEWLEHLFGSLDKTTINKMLENSIYRYENRIRMEIKQDGATALTLFQCDNCQSHVNSSGIYQHSQVCNVCSVKYFCKICKRLFVDNASKTDHEDKHHELPTNLKFRIITFNRKEDKDYNKNLTKMKYYLLFQCRYCHVVIENKNIYNKHICNSDKCKNCNVCGLLINERDYATHVYKHKVIKSFDRKVMKVVLIGNKPVNIYETRTNSLMSKFSGMVCDYMFYKCVRCEVCVRYQRNTIRHDCLIDAAKSKCRHCGLTFDEGKIKSHLKLHEIDPDFTIDLIMIIEFGFKIEKSEEYCASASVEDEANDCIKDKIVVPNAGVQELNSSAPKIAVKIYKCDCGLHFINEIEIKEHFKNCSGVIKGKQSIQDCFKCGLTFTANVLFKHLLEHHGNKNDAFKYEIIDCFNNCVTSV